MSIRRFGRLTGWLIAIGISLWLGTWAGVAIVQRAWPTPGPLPEPADAIVCLGAGAATYNGMPRPDEASLRRALTCGRLQVEGVAPVVVFTGGLTGGLGSAGAAMARAAETVGMARDDQLIERASLSTIQNAAFSLPLLPEGTERIVVVSDAFHLPRAWFIFKAFGFDEVALYAAHPLTEAEKEMAEGTQDMSRWVQREALAIWFNAARAAAYVAGGWLGHDHDTRIAWFN